MTIQDYVSSRDGLIEPGKILSECVMRQPPEKLWTIDDVADYLQVKPSVVKYWAKNDTIPYIRIGRFVRFNQSDVVAWVKENGKQNVILNREKLRRIEL